MSISNYEDVIDSREILSRIEELEEEIEACNENAGVGSAAEESVQELAALTKLIEDAEKYSGDSAEDGFTLIRDSYFTDYAVELCRDIGNLPNGIPSYIEIDWEATAKNIQQDYTSVEFDGVTYWVR